jgi:predicted transcriptional regulator
MAEKSKTREITIVDDRGTFTSFFKRLSGESSDGYDFEGLAALRHILSNQKARLLHIVKTRNPASIYALAKLLGRDFKSVKDDVALLERFGFIDLVAERTGKRERLKPIVVTDTINIKIKL